MYTFRVFLALVLFNCAVAAPPADMPAECLPPKGTEKEASQCCKMAQIFGSSEAGAAFKQCQDMVKEKPAEGDKAGKPEGFECMDDCLFSKIGLLADKKINEAELASRVKTAYAGEWAEVGAKAGEKCLAAAKSSTDKLCPSGADIFVQCIFRETYMNCPDKNWTASDVCKANKERLQKCPRALPFLGPMLEVKA
ncbi:Odorant-Hypothetical protein protein 50c [Nesidiocoris tenuis]|uniref:Uncharacterized protein n=1 Tax=Nesidiocoris tenuis TaxID=355587 RepID=A0ABN7BE14_9HEMI|nr:Odorant-Hypothetical protein protein 50c [Nesidiocoris tenuis]